MQHMTMHTYTMGNGHYGQFKDAASPEQPDMQDNITKNLWQSRNHTCSSEDQTRPWWKAEDSVVCLERYYPMLYIVMYAKETRQT